MSTIGAFRPVPVRSSSAAGDPHSRQRGEHRLVDRVVNLRERPYRFARETRQRILTTQPNEVDPLAKIRAQRQMVPPRAVDAGERDRPLGVEDGPLACRRDERRAAFGRALPDVQDVFTGQNRAPPFDELAMLLLDHGGVARERPPNLEVLPLDDALRARDFTPDDRALDGDVGLLGKVSRRNQTAGCRSARAGRPRG